MPKQKAPDVHPSIEIDQDLDHARALWRVQRVGWIVIALIIIAGAAGAFGDGPLAHASVSSSGLVVRYDRLARHGAPTTIDVEVPPAMRRGDTLRFWIDRRYADGVKIESVTPEPARSETQSDSLWFTVMAPQSTSPARVNIVLRPQDFGSRSGRLGVHGFGSVAFRQFVYP
jgi:hypothetical protein